MRPYESKKFGVWLDHSGNYLRFRKEWDERFEEGVTELDSESAEKAKKEPTEKEKKEAKCPACSVLWTWSSNVCGACGYEKPIRAVASVPGELQELQANGDRSRQINQEFYSELIYFARMRGYKEGWAAYKYKEKFGVMPRGLTNAPKAPSQATVRWVQSRNIAWARSKGKA
jgi:hypothetical protein